MGWSVGLPVITRKTDKGVPTYDDAAERDTFVLSGAEDLVPVIGADGRPAELARTVEGRDYTIVRYRPRVDGLNARIERWRDRASLDVHWRSISRDNVTTVYGKDAESRIADPDDQRRVFSWLACQSWDDRGNAIVYRYRAEDSAALASADAHERNRTERGRSANRHLKSVRYGNRVSSLIESDLESQTWHFELVFDYGEHDEETPTPADPGEWLCRRDPFSSYRAGFEIRNYRLCRRILMFHHFPGETDIGADCLVRSMTLSYRGSPTRGEPAGAFLQSVQVTGHRTHAGGYATKSMPPVEFTYGTGAVGTEVNELDATSIANLPVGLDGSGYQWVDLDGESIAGVLTQQAGGWFYTTNHGDGRLGPVRMLPTQPAGVEATQLLDLAGDGALDLVSFAGPVPGFFERADGPADDREWTSLRALRSLPELDWADPELRFVDLNGDGHADALVPDGDDLVWYPSLGEEGFGSGVRVALPQDEHSGPRLVVGDARQAIFLADMSGDGLTDLVRVSNGAVCYWPNLGHGRFGAQVVMDAPGPFDEPDRFDPRRIRVADLDGSGPSDLVYLGSSGVELYTNQSGNRWSIPRQVPAFPVVDDLALVSVFDLLGHGTACLVWSSALPADAGRRIRYVDLMGKKPNLLERVRNNLGAETVLTYASSTSYYLMDREAGTPWITRLPFPVHVLATVETYDWISRNRFTSSYTYHHGHYDGHEREFRGFGMVEQLDTELTAALARVSAFPVGDNEDDATRMPPVRTRTWFHIGAFIERHRISTLFADGYYPPPEHATAQAARLLLPDTVLPPDLAVDEERDACRALKGQLLRQEVYAVDGTELEPHPYTVIERNYSVVRRQAGVFAVDPRETVTIAYERNSADPRITHEVVLDVDPYGTVLHSAALAYRRATSDAALPERTRAVQAGTLVTDTRNAVTDLVDADDAFRVPVVFDAQTFEVSVPALSNAAALVDRDELRAELTPANGRRLIDRAVTLFERDDLSGPLPTGEQGTRAFVHTTRRLALPAPVLDAAFGARVDAQMLSTAGYVEAAGEWWLPSGTVRYGDDLAQALAGFFVPRRYVDPFGNVTAVELDSYNLIPMAVTDPVGNQVAARADYRLLAPIRITDANGNQVEALFDALGLVVATAARGKQGDETREDLTGLDPEPDTMSFWSDPLAAAPEFLGDATTRIVYDLEAYLRTRDDADPQPAAAATIARELHVRDADPSPLQVAIAYSDGVGREIQRKAQAPPEHGWLASGWTIFNNKGLPVRQYEPFFTPTHRFEFAVLVGVSGVLCYDPVGRAVATLHPDHTWEKVVVEAWRQETWDGCDTVVIPDPAADEQVGAYIGKLPVNDYQPTWYAAQMRGEPVQQLAAQRSELHAATPTLSVFDPLGRIVLTAARNRTPGTPPVDTEYCTHVVLDIEGNQLEVLDCTDGTASVMTDSADRLVARYTYDLASARVVEESMEAGTRRILLDVLGAPAASWDHTDRRTTMTYDAARRPGEVVLRDSGGEMTVGQTVYGEAAPDTAANLRGRPWQVFDGAGVVTYAYDLEGNVKQLDRQLTREYRDVVDWSTSPALEPDSWTSRTLFDALGRPRMIMHPDGTEVRPGYGRDGLLAQVEARLAGDAQETVFIRRIEYDPKGQRRVVEHGNRVTVRYDYDELTFRLRGIDTRNQAGERVQLLDYTYDPVGNIIEIADGAQQQVFNRNALVDPSTNYVYDATYRLVGARGREHRGDGSGDEPASTSFTDAQDLVRYTERYAYDAAGNMTQLVHDSPNGTGWTRRFTCNERSQLEPGRFSNRLSATQVGSRAPDSFAYDDHGNMLTLQPLELMRWNHLDQLVATSRQRVTSGVGEITYYTYDSFGQRVRKVTDRAAASITAANRRKERIYISDFEIYREFDATGRVTFARTTVHIGDGAGRAALVETRVGAGPQERLVRYQYANHLGSAIVELDADAAPISYEEFYPYGSAALFVSRGGIPPKRYRYTGKERDEESDLNYHGTRYYVPWICRWSAADQADTLDGPNLYSYVSDSPVHFHDPDGRAAKSPELPLEVRQRLGAQSLARAHARSMTQAEVENPRANFKSARDRNWAVGRRAHALTEEFARFTWPNDAITSSATHPSTAGRTQIDVEIPSLRLTAELSSSRGAAEHIPRKLQQVPKQLEVAADRGHAYAAVYDGDFDILSIEEVSAVVADAGWTEEIKLRNSPNAPRKAASRTSAKGQRDYASLETPLKGVGGLVQAGMVYTDMKQAELDAEEQGTFEPIKDETAKQLGGLAGGIAGVEIGVGLGLPGGPAGILAGTVVGFIGGSIGYGSVGTIVDETVDPSIKRFCGVDIFGDPL
jgi:RHS repeat-associated protein